MSVLRVMRTISGVSLLCVALTACGMTRDVDLPKLSEVEIDPARQALAIREVAVLRSQGRRAWCVPFARNLSGIEIRGNANTWWGQAEGVYDRSAEPRVGSVMAFSKSRRLTMGHVAVVSEIVNDRLVLLNHANWHRNKVSLGMAVLDVSEAGDWSAVKVESSPGAFGSVYPVSGFIHPKTNNAI